MKRQNWMVLIISLIGLFLMACSSESENDFAGEASESSNEKVTLKLASFYGKEAQGWPTYLEPWMKRVEELSDGRVGFNVFPSEQLGKAADLLNLTRDGVTDISVIANSYTSSQMPLTAMLQGLPRLAENQEQATLAFYDLLKEDEDILEIDYKKNGVLPLTTFVTPAYDLWSVGKEYRTPADIKDLKIRTPGGVANEFFEYAGAVPVSISTTETYEALEKGVIKVAAYFAEGTVSSGTNELLTHQVATNTGSVFFTTIINEKKWASLPTYAQEAIQQANDEIVQTVGKDFSEAEEQIKKDFVSKGGTLVELTESEKDEWDKISKEFIRAWLDKQDGSLPYDTVLKHYQQLVEKY